MWSLSARLVIQWGRCLAGGYSQTSPAFRLTCSPSLLIYFGGGVHLAALLFPLNTELLPHLPIPFLCHPSMGPLFCSTWILPVSMELLKVGLQKPKLIRGKKKRWLWETMGQSPSGIWPHCLVTFLDQFHWVEWCLCCEFALGLQSLLPESWR